MVTGLAGRDAGAPPGRSWLVELLAPRPAPVPWGLAAEAAAAVGGSFGVGLLSGHTVEGLLASLGALPAANVDRGGPLRLRLRRMAAAAIATAAGLVVGTGARGSPVAVVLTACAVAAVAGLVSSVGPAASLFGLHLLIYTVIAALDPLPGPAWRTALIALTGAAGKVALCVAAAGRGRSSPERRAVAAAFDAVAATMAAAGTGGATGARQAMTGALDAAEDALVSLRTGLGGPDPDSIELVRALEAAVGLAGVATARVATGRLVGPVAVGAVRDLAAFVRARAAGAGWGPPLLDPGDRDLVRPLAAAARSVLGRAGEDTAEVVLRSRRRRPASERLAAAWGRVAAPRSLAAAGRLVLCVAVAEVCATSLGERRPYWVPLTVAVALKPDFGSVFARAVQRAVGTAVGVVVGAAVLVAVSDRRELVPVLVVLAALLPVTVVRNYGMFVTVLTPLVLVQVDALAPAPGQLVGARLLDTLLGSSIVLVVGFGIWPSTWRPRLTADLEAGVAAVAESLRSPGDLRHRRAAYRRLGDLRTTWSRHFADPSPTGGQARALWPAVIALEAVLDRAVALHADAHHADGGAATHRAMARRLAVLADELTAAAAGEATGGGGDGGDAGRYGPRRRDGRATPDTPDDLDDLVGEVAAAVARAGAPARALLRASRRPGPAGRRRRARRGRAGRPRR